MSARRKRGDVDVLPPESVPSSSIQVRIDAAYLRSVALAARATIAEVKLPKVLRLLKKHAETGALDCVVKFPDDENWRAAVALESIADPLHRLGFGSKSVMVPHQRGYGGEEAVPALHVIWSGGVSA